jgi:hypothetical protein
MKQIVDKKQSFIGINQYLNETETSDFWLIPMDAILGLQPFVLEYEYLLTHHEK